MKKRLNLILAVSLVFAIVLLSATTRSQTNTELNITQVPNTPPIFTGAIPDQIWAKNTNLESAFNLDDYFIDNETLSYTSSSVQNITVTISNSSNGTAHYVSFYPDSGFTGIRTVIFTATDGIANGTSNSITLNVTEDSIPPQWSNPSKDKADTDIFQNTFVNFSAEWTDNIQLGSFYLSINQGSGFSDQTSRSFSGKSGTSSERIQISAAGGTVVYWKFVGLDSSGNQNETSVQNFTVTSQDQQSNSQDDNSDTSTPTAQPRTTSTKETILGFSIDPESVIEEIKQGETSTLSFKITNTGNTNTSFELRTENLELFSGELSDFTFTLPEGEFKTFTLTLSADRFLTPDLYFGKIKVTTSQEVKEVPIVLEVQPFESQLGLEVSLDPEFEEIKGGDIITANVTLKNLKDIETKQVTLYYAISDLSGNVVDVAQEEISFGTSTLILKRNLSTTRESLGEHLFYARAVSGDNIALDSKSFFVGERFSLASFVRSNLLIIAILIFMMVAVLLGMKYYKDQERMRLLNLYIMINEMKELMKENKTEEAIDLYVKIKRSYGQPLSQTAIENRQELKKEMSALSKKVDSLEEAHPEIKKEAENIQKDDKSENKETDKQPDTEKDKKETEKQEEAPKTENKKEEASSPEQKEDTKKPEKKQEPKTEKVKENKAQTPLKPKKEKPKIKSKSEITKEIQTEKPEKKLENKPDNQTEASKNEK